MEEYPFQPTLLSLQDMLNLSGDEEDTGGDWASNPYNIHNFFEPIVSPVKGAAQQTSSSQCQTGTAGPSNDGSRSSPHSSVNQNQYINPFSTPPKKRQHSQSPKKAPMQQASQKEKSEVIHDVEDNDDFLQCLDIFDEGLVNAELQHCDKTAECVEPSWEVREGPSDTSFEAADQSVIVESDSSAILPDSDDDEQEGSYISREEFIGPELDPPRLEEVRFDDRGSEKGRKRRQAIYQLGSLINILKRYSSVLQTFLVTEGDLVLEHYDAQNMLSGILPEMEAESPHSSHPFDVGHSITRALVDRVKGRTVLSTFPPRRPHLWLTSELLQLQKAVLESAITRKEFRLYCRYTDLLTDMGFDDDDLSRLKKCSTKDTELGTLKIIMNEHQFLSKSQFSKKQAIRTVIIRRDAIGGPRALVLPSPERLVQDKWTALMEIRRRTVPSTLKDKDIDWLFVLKKMWMQNHKFRVDEDTCKLAYDHLLSYKYNGSPWRIDELKTLQAIRENFSNMSWAQVAQRLGTNRTPFACFTKYRAYCVNDLHKQEMSRDTLRIVNACYVECRGNVARLDYHLSKSLPGVYKSIKNSRLLILFRQVFNDRLKKGSFTVVEDALLLATMEKFQKYLVENSGMMNPIAYTLPWRYSSLWRLRLKRLLTGFYYKKWTLDDDKRLLSLVEEYGSNYKVIQRYFPHKHRKQCRCRYFQLLEIFKTTSLEDYHLVYHCTAGGFNLERLNKIVEYLNVTIKSKIAGNLRYVCQRDLEFLKFRRAPSEKELERYLMTFPLPVLVSALNRLADCLMHITEKWKEMKSTVASDPLMSQKTDIVTTMVGFNRRIFNPQCPASVASALHLRKAKLLPREFHEDLTTFEENVYNYHKYFCLKSAAKLNTMRTGVPSLDTLRKLTSISRLIEKPHVRQGDGQSAVIMQVKSETLEDMAKKEAIAFQEIQNQKLGGRLKGSKRRKTKTREAKQRAANIRWGRKKLLSNHDDASGITSPWTSENDFSYPPTPSSVASFSTGDGSEDTYSISGTGFDLRSAIDGLISDHAYILPMQNPLELSSVPALQLSSLLGHQRPLLQRLREKTEAV